MASLIVQPRYPNDPLPDVVDDFVTTLAADFPEHEIEVTREEPWGHQVSPLELLTVWLPVGISLVELGKYVLTFTAWLKKRRAQTAGERAHGIKIYGPDGKVIRLLTVERGSDDVIAEDPDPNEPPLLPPHR